MMNEGGSVREERGKGGVADGMDARWQVGGELAEVACDEDSSPLEL